MTISLSGTNNDEINGSWNQDSWRTTYMYCMPRYILADVLADGSDHIYLVSVLLLLPENVLLLVLLLFILHRIILFLVLLLLFCYFAVYFVVYNFYIDAAAVYYVVLYCIAVHYLIVNVMLLSRMQNCYPFYPWCCCCLFGLHLNPTAATQLCWW